MIKSTFLVAMCLCGTSLAQQYGFPQQGHPGYAGGAPAAAAPAAHAAPQQWAAPQAAPQAAQAGPVDTGAWDPAKYGAHLYGGAAPPAGAAGAAPRPYQAAPAAAHQTPMNYGWNVQHQSAPQPQPQPQHAAPAAPAAAQWAAAPQGVPAAPSAAQWAAAPQPANQYQQQYQLAQQQQLAQLQQARAAQGAAPRYPAAPQAAQAAPQSPVFKPAAVHYANIGENLAGDYKFGYRTGNGDSFREESRLPDGSVQGQYGFVDADGKERIVKYSAGVNGFQVLNDSPAASSAPARPAAQAAPAWGQQHAQAAAPGAVPGAAQWGGAAQAGQQNWG